MNIMEIPNVEKAETLKEVIQNICAINNEMSLQLHIIADALIYGSHPTNSIEKPDELLPIMDFLRQERDKAEENLKLLISIRECLW